MSEITIEQKCVLYERILKYMMGATEIRFKSLSKDGEYGFIEFVDVDPDDFKIEGFDDGLYLEYSSEAYMEDYGGIIEPREETRIITEIWFGEDPWATIKALKRQVQSLAQSHPHDDAHSNFSNDETDNTNVQSLSETTNSLAIQEENVNKDE